LVNFNMDHGGLTFKKYLKYYRYYTLLFESIINGYSHFYD
jgi:hypothetical protein